METIMASYEAIWIQKLLTGLFGQELERWYTTIIRVVSKSMRIQYSMTGPRILR
jgi:hypothetical protein